MKYVIIGGVAAGAGAAARIRRLDEKAEIVIFERGEFISFANCGLPYHVGGVIEDRGDLLVMPKPKFAAWFNTDIRTNQCATEIHRDKKTVTITPKDGNAYEESYDKLLIATGSHPSSINIPGGDLPQIQSLWNIPDMDRIIRGITARAKHVIVIGGGFIGLETAENLLNRGLKVTLIEQSDHILPTVDAEMAILLTEEMQRLGVRMMFNQNIVKFEQTDDGRITAVLQSGERITADHIISSVGVRPNSELAAQAGLTLGKRGHIHVNEHLQTSDPDIYAAGDVIEVISPITHTPTAVPLAGPANKQARIAADNMTGRSNSSYRFSYGTSVIKIGKLTSASVGITEQALKSTGETNYLKIYIHPATHATYYPGGTALHIKFIFRKDGTILGGQIIGESGADKRVDTIAVAMRYGLKAYDLAEFELAYAPPFNSAKDPVNFLGMIAQDIRDGLTEVVTPDNIPEDALLIDVRKADEIAEFGAIPKAINIPIETLRDHLSELDPKKLLIMTCRVGRRAYIAERILKQHGFRVKNLSGGFLTWKQMQNANALQKS
ncbi:MAG: FAD-dependent oxidoreductase [Lentisphaeria bacterium]